MADKDREQIRRLREQANALRKQEEARRRRNRMFTQIGVVVGALALVAIVVVVVVMGPAWFGKQNTPSASGTMSVTDSTGAKVEVPVSVQAGGFTIGASDAPATIDYYFDFSCPHCIDFHSKTGTAVEQMIADGDAQVNFHVIKFVQDYGIRAGAALTSAVQYQPDLFFTVLDGLFAIPAEQQMNFTNQDYATQLQALGVTNDAAIKSVNDGDFTWWIKDNTTQARAAGVPGTPSIYINGELQENLPQDGPGLIALVKAAGGSTQPAPTQG